MKVDASDEDVIAAWDEGQSVWSVELGGLGPGYEQCIQLMGFEAWKLMRTNPPADGWDGLEGDAWRTYRDSIEAMEPLRGIVDKLGVSGAQFGAAMNIASVFARQGYAAGMAKAPKDRHIQVSKNFPAIA